MTFSLVYSLGIFLASLSMISMSCNLNVFVSLALIL